VAISQQKSLRQTRRNLSIFTHIVVQKIPVTPPLIVENPHSPRERGSLSPTVCAVDVVTPLIPQHAGPGEAKTLPTRNDGVAIASCNIEP
jgi:hypothetical protein